MDVYILNSQNFSQLATLARFTSQWCSAELLAVPLEHRVVQHRLQTLPPDCVQIFLSPASMATALATLGESLLERTSAYVSCRHSNTCSELF